MERLTLQRASEILLENVEKIEEYEEIPLWDATGRILAEDVYALRNQPPFSRSPLDGYAVRSEDLKGASREHPVILTVIDEVDAGHITEKRVGQKMAVRIMTGAPIPNGADCVVGQEDTDYGEEMVAVYEEIGAYQNYCFEGEDYKTGARLLAKNMSLGFIEAGVLASLGREKIKVFRRPKVAVLTTGDELRLPGETLLPGKIYDSNLYTIVTRLRSLGMEIAYYGRAEDDAGVVAERVREAARDADLIITTGGVSVGKKDIMHEVLTLLDCERLFWGIAIKPGMPTLCAKYQGKLLICLSGNPYGAAVNLELLIRPVLAEMSGRYDLRIKRVNAVTESEFPKPSRVTRYVRARYADGRVWISEGSNDSGILSSMCGCNCLVEIPAGTRFLRKGEMVEIVMLS